MASQGRNRRAVVAGGLLGTFAGDALGAPWEGSRPAEGRDGSGRVARTLRDRAELRYTDDTQLTLALAEHLLASPDVEPSGLVATFLDHHEPGRGYGGGFLRLVDEWRAGTSVDRAATSVFPGGSFGNGAAMRVAPVGLLHADDLERVDIVARRQAEPSHAHPLGRDGAAVQARAVALAAVRGSFDRDTLVDAAAGARERELVGGLDRAAELAAAWPASDLSFRDVAEALGNEVIAQRSVPAALWVAAVADGVEDGVALALGLGGDADTIAAMAGAILGAAGTDAAVPGEWVARFEDGRRGVTYARDLAERLADRTAG